MFNKIFSLCLISITSLCLSTFAADEDQKQPTPAADSDLKTASTTKVHTLQLPGMELKGEEINYNVQRDGKHEISLSGQSMLKIDEMVMTADSIHVTYSKIESGIMDLKGKVTIFSKGDKLQANAMEAKFDFGANLLTLKGKAPQEALLIRYNSSKTTHMKAAEIQIQFTEQNTVSIKSQGPVEITERKPNKDDDLFSPRSSPQNVFGRNPQDTFDSSLNQFAPTSQDTFKKTPFSGPNQDFFSTPIK